MPFEPLAKHVDLNLLELFDAVYRLKNLTAAGKRLGLSQPAVSHGVARLRELYSDALFVRTPRGVVATPFADGLAEPIATALEIVRGTIGRVTFAPGKARRQFRIVMTDIAERMFLPPLLRWLANEAPHVTLETLPPPVHDVGSALASGDIDLAIGYLPTFEKQLLHQTLFSESFVYIRRANHPMGRRRLTRADIGRLPHLLASPPGTDHALAVEKVLSAPAIRAPIALRILSFLSAAPIVAQTDLIAPLPANLVNVVKQHLDIDVCIPPVRFPDFDVSMYWHQRFHQDPANQFLRDGIDALFSGGRLFRS